MIESRHSSVFKQKLAVRRLELLEALASGSADGFGSYKQLVGQVQGLDDALKLSEDADFEINGGS